MCVRSRRRRLWRRGGGGRLHSVRLALAAMHMRLRPARTHATHAASSPLTMIATTTATTMTMKRQRDIPSHVYARRTFYLYVMYERARNLRNTRVSGIRSFRMSFCERKRKVHRKGRTNARVYELVPSYRMIVMIIMSIIEFKFCEFRNIKKKFFLLQ